RSSRWDSITCRNSAVNRLLVTMFCLLTLPAIAADRCTIVAGQGCGELRVGKSKQSDVFRSDGDEKRYHDDGLDLNFGKDGVLGTLVIGNSAYRTNLGLAVGDDEEKVRRVYGIPQKVERFTLSKGENEPIGFVGDRTLEYPGIGFIIVKKKVWLILVIP
ncbi:MAG: hypothetical protein ABSG72_18395, partial [Candidatus Sulfotelmatobacter sp.]